MADRVKIIIANELMYRTVVDNDHIISVNAADAIARANGYPYAESFVRTHRGMTLILDEKDRIEKVLK